MSHTRIFVFDLLCLIGFMITIFASAFGAKIGLTIGVQWYVIAAFWLGVGHHHFQQKAIEARCMGLNKAMDSNTKASTSTLDELAELRKQYDRERDEAARK